MDLVSTARVVRRRWYAAVIGLVCTLIGAAAVLAMAPTYEATSVLVLLAPNTPPAVAPGTPGSTPAAVNPYQAFDSSITITAELMSTQVMQPRVVGALVKRGASPTYTVATDPDTGGPTVTITAKAPTPRQALLTNRLVSAEFRRQLTERQSAAGAPSDSLISASEIVTPTAADRLVSGRVRALIAVLAVGVVFSICLCLAAESLALARERRLTRQQTPPSPAADPSGDGTGDGEPVGAGAPESGAWR